MESRTWLIDGLQIISTIVQEAFTGLSKLVRVIVANPLPWTTYVLIAIILMVICGLLISLMKAIALTLRHKATSTSNVFMKDMIIKSKSTDETLGLAKEVATELGVKSGEKLNIKAIVNGIDQGNNFNVVYKRKYLTDNFTRENAQLPEILISKLIKNKADRENDYKIIISPATKSWDEIAARRVIWMAIITSAVGILAGFTTNEVYYQRSLYDQEHQTSANNR